MALSTTLSISDPAELARAAAALGRHADGIDGVERGVTAARRRIEGQVGDGLARLEAAVRRAEQALAGARDEAGARRAAAELARAQAARAEGRRVQREVTQTLDDLHREVRDRVGRTRTLAGEGSRGLRSLWERLDRVRSGFSSAAARHRAPGGPADPRGIVDGGASGRTPFGATGSRTPEEFPILDGRRRLIPLDRLVDREPISGPESFEKLPLPAMQEGLRSLEERVLPAVRRGVGREGVRALDEQAGTAGSPDGLLAVYDAFFGGEEHAVVVTRDGRGGFEIQEGHHRFWAAQRMHLEALPVVLR